MVRYKDEYGNSVILNREDDGDFNIRVISYDESGRSKDETLITKQDFEKMKRMDEIAKKQCVKLGNSVVEGKE